MNFDCFISYASAGDFPLAEELYARLTRAGFKVWFDKIRLIDGFHWHQQIEAGLEESRVVLAVLTPDWQRSEWTRYETYAAERVIPLVFKGTWDEVKTPPLEAWQGQISRANHRTTHAG